MRFPIEEGDLISASSVDKGLNAYYQQLDSRHSVTETGNYERLVVPQGNSDEAVHRWFHVKEAYSHAFLPRVLKDTDLAARGELVISDPFSGSGTTAVSAASAVVDGSLQSVHVHAAEVNPFLHLVGSSKLAVYQEEASAFLPLAKKVAARVLNGLVGAPPVPQLSTFLRPGYFAPGVVRVLTQLRVAIDDESGRVPGTAVQLARLCLAAAIEPSSQLRRDGRALRYTPLKKATDPVAEFLRRAHEIDDDLPEPTSSVRGAIAQADSRELPALRGAADLVVFSPPYPNNIDYTEVYKLEAWLLGLIGDQRQFADQRRRTARSHPSLKFGDAYRYTDSSWAKEVTSLLAPVLAAVPTQARYESARKRLIRGYFDDMLTVLAASYESLRPGGRLVYVVGNSLHGNAASGSVLVAADTVMAELARLCGFDDIQLDVARRPSRRGASPYLRESVVFARKPEARFGR